VSPEVVELVEVAVPVPAHPARESPAASSAEATHRALRRRGGGAVVGSVVALVSFTPVTLGSVPLDRL